MWRLHAMDRRPVDEVLPPAKVDKLGSYTLSSLIASGALGTLHRARVPLTPETRDAKESTYAIKRLQPRHAADPQLRGVFLATGQAGLALNIPHLVRVVAVHEEPEPFLVMQ